MERVLDPRDEGRLPVITRWEDFSTWLLEAGARMPRHWRHSLVSRLDQEALEILMLLTEAAYRKEKIQLLRETNIRLSRLRALLGICLKVKAMSPGAHELALRAVDDVGRMVGGWAKEVASRERP